MKRSRRSRAAAAIMAVGIGAAVIGTASPASASHREVHTVHPGESIQAAIDAAQPGASIRIKAGTYHENVYVNKDNIELEGDGADETILMPPAVATPSRCADETGIFGAVCVGLEADPVEGFELEDMKIEGFLNGAFLVNTAGAEVKHMVFANNSEYGAFYNSSTGGHYHHNVAYGAEEAGLYFGDSVNADVEVEENEVYDNGLGILLVDSSNGEVEDNYSHDNCFGILALSTGEPNETSGWDIEHNTVVHNNKACPAGDDAPPLSGAGIVLAGATGNVVKANEVNDNVASGPSLVSGGIVLSSASELGGSPASDNLIKRNELSGNQPYDISDDGAGTGNRFKHNDCETSSPAGLCGGGDGDNDRRD